MSNLPSFCLPSFKSFISRPFSYYRLLVPLYHSSSVPLLSFSFVIRFIRVHGLAFVRFKGWYQSLTEPNCRKGEQLVQRAREARAKKRSEDAGEEQGAAEVFRDGVREEEGGEKDGDGDE